MTSYMRGFCIDIYSIPEESSPFTRMKNFFQGKMSQMAYVVRKTASLIVTCGASQDTDLEIDDVLPERRSISGIKLRKLKESIFFVAPDPNGNDVRGFSYFFRPGFIPPTASPRNGFDEDDEQYDNAVLNIIQDVEQTPDDDRTESAHGLPDPPVVKTPLRHVRELEAAVIVVRDRMRAREEVNMRSSVQESDADHVVTKKLKKRKRPKAAKCGRVGTIVPPLVATDDGAEVLKSKKRKKRPNAAKGQRKESTGATHLIDLPCDVLVERFKDKTAEPTPITRKRPKVARRRLKDVQEGIVGHSADLELHADKDAATAQADSNDVSKGLNGDDTSSLDKLLVDLGLDPCKQKDKKSVHADDPGNIDDILYTEDEGNGDDDDDDDDIFNVPFLPKAQRKAYYYGKR